MPRLRGALLASTLVLLGAAAPGSAQAAPSPTAYALSGTTLVSFGLSSPGAVSSQDITGVTPGETLVAIDVRPANGLLYALGVNAAADTGTLYAVNRWTGFAAAVGGPSGVAFAATDLPDPTSVGYGFDFDPRADRARVVAGSLNFRIDPNTGSGVDRDANGGNGITPDLTINGATTTLDAAAYTNNLPRGSYTTAYTLDATTNTLNLQSAPVAGTSAAVAPVTLNGSPLDFTAVDGFDIAPGIDTSFHNTAVTAGSGYATLRVGGVTGLYRIDLVTGQATALGAVGTGAADVSGLALERDYDDDAGYPMLALWSAPAQLVQFSSGTADLTSATTMSAPAAGETIVALGMRSQTGQLYALGIDDVGNAGTLYLVDTATAELTAVGSAGQVAFVDGGGTAVDLPASSAGWGLDFNPAVDRVRVTTTTGLNFRVNPNNGTPVDGNLGGIAVVGTNPDGPINGLGLTGVTAVAYTSAFPQLLTGASTTLYTLDGTSDALYVQNPPNLGTQTAKLPLTIGGAPLAFDSVAGFDIPAEVNVDPFYPAGTGEGFAALRQGGTTSLYRINLVTGAAQSLGAIGDGSVTARSLVVGDVQRRAPAVSALPVGLDFGTAAATKDVVVTNTTSSPVFITGTSVSGDSGFTVSGCAAGTTLQAGEACTATVRFAPDSAGGKAGTLTVDSNAPDLTVALTGSGTATTAPSTPGPAPAPGHVTPVVPAAAITNSGGARVKGKMFDTGLRVTCPRGRTSPCTGSVRVTRTLRRKARTLAKGTFSVRPGASLALKVKPSALNLRILKKTRRLAVKMTVTPNGALPKTFTAKLKKGRA